MVKCQICGHSNPPRAIACHQCGVHLDQELLRGNITPTQDKQVPLPLFTLEISPTALSFQFHDTRHILMPEPEIYLGREFAEGFSHAHLDLQAFNGWMYGISRIHARLELDPLGRYHIVDLGSTNGTLLNNELLTAFQQYPLKNDDLIALSNFPILIQFNLP